MNKIAIRNGDMGKNPMNNTVDTGGRDKKKWEIRSVR